MKVPGDVQERIAVYLRDVESNLGGMPEPERRELLRALERHIADALDRRGGAPTVNAVDAVLADMDPPASFASDENASPAVPSAPAAQPAAANRWFLLALAFLALNGWAVWKMTRPAAGSSAAARLVKFLPGENAELRDKEPLQWRFSTDMVPFESVGKPLDAPPVRLEPPVAGAFRWDSERLLVFTPKQPWRAGKLYTASPVDGLADAEGRLVEDLASVLLRSPVLRVLEVEQADLAPGREAVLRLTFNAPPDPASLEKHLVVKTGLAEDRPLPYTLVGKAVTTEMLIRTATVPRDRLELLFTRGLAPAEGELAMAEDQRFDVAVTEKLQLRKLKPRSPAFAPCNLQAYFTTGLDVERAAPFIDVQPPVRFTVEPLDSWEGGGCTLSGDFQPGQPYAVTFKAGLPSQNGASLTADLKRYVHFPNRPASLAFAADGRYLSPQGSLRVPLTAMNLSECKVAVRPVFPNNLVQFALRDADLVDRFWGSDDEDSAAVLTGASVERTYTLADRPNEPLEVTVPLRDFGSDAPGGAYLVTARAEKAGSAHRLVVVTDLGLSARVARDAVLVRVNSLRTAAPADGVEVALYSRANQELARGITGPDGLVVLRRPDNGEGPAAPFLLTAALAGDLSFLALHGTEADPAGDFGGRAFLGEGVEAFVYTDRGIYRPGETAHVKALVRDRELRAPQPFPALFRVRRPDGRIDRDLPALLNGIGAATAELEFPVHLPTGTYTLELVLPGSFTVLGRTSIALEDFVPPQIAVKVESVGDAVPGQPIAFDAAARYLFGRAASGLPVSATASIEAAPFAPTNWPGFVFGDAEKKFSNRNLSLGAGRLDAEGRGRFSLTVDPTLRPPAALKVFCGATVTEASGRAVTDYGSTKLDLYPFYIGFKPNRGGGFVRAGEALAFDLAAVCPDGTVFEKAPPLKATLARVEWTSALRRRSDGRYTWTSERFVQPVEEKLVALNGGRAEASLTPPRPGAYLLTVADPANGASTSYTFHAGTPDQQWVSWARDKPGQVELVPDRPVYRPGDTARVLIKAPFAGPALLTVEQDRVLEHRVLALDGNTLEVEIPVRASYAPNVYCTVSVLRPAVAESVWSAHRAIGAAVLMVEPPGRRLTVELDAPETIRPASRVEAALRLRDETGAPVQGELSVAAVDEAICLLTGFETPDPAGFFAARRALGVLGFDLYSLLMPEIDEVLGGGASHTAGGGSAALRRRLNPVNARRFKPVALWHGTVTTDSNGTARVAFDVPEFTGQLRFMAVAATAAQTGSAECRAFVKRPLIVQPSLPRFLAPGDEARVAVQVFNETGADRDIRLRLACRGPLTAPGPEQVLALAAGAGGAALFTLRAGDQPGVAHCTIEADGGGESYRETIELAVRPAAAPVAVVTYGKLEAGETAAFEAPADWMPGTVHIEAAALARPELQLGGALDYLLRYPYGCLEQTVSSAFPLLYLADLANSWRPEALGREETAGYVRAGLYRVLSMQQSDGRFAPWPRTDGAYGWGSLYATHFLLEADKARYAVPADRLKAALDALRERLGETIPSDAGPANAWWRQDMEERAYACHLLALAGTPDRGWMARLKEFADRLNASGRVHLALAYLHAGEPRTMSALLETCGVPAVDAPRETGDCLNSGIRDTALVLSAWLDLQPDLPSVDDLAMRLSGAQVRGRWYTTQENAMALLALGKLYNRRTPDDRPYAGTWTAGTAAAAPFDRAKAFRWVTPDDGPRPGKASLANRGPGSFYYCVKMEGIPATDEPPEAARGLSVRRELLDLGGNLRHDWTLSRGELAVVRIRIDTQGRRVANLAIVDLLPAGWEIENPNLASSQLVPWLGERNNWCRQREIRDDRIILFTGWMHGAFEYCYAVRAVTPGRFTLPALQAESMYDPEIRGVQGRAVIEVNP